MELIKINLNQTVSKAQLEQIKEEQEVYQKVQMLQDIPYSKHKKSTGIFHHSKKSIHISIHHIDTFHFL